MRTIEDCLQMCRESWHGKTGEFRAVAVKGLLDRRLPEYASRLGLTEEQVWNAIESRRDYHPINYYQECNFPPLDNVTVYETKESVKAMLATAQFRCPACRHITTEPTICNSGAEMSPGRVCDWKAYGFFKTLGAGHRFICKETFLEDGAIYEIFKPLSLEQEATK